MGQLWRLTVAYSEREFWRCLAAFTPVERCAYYGFPRQGSGCVPIVAPHYTQEIGGIFLEMFAGLEFLNVSIKQWIRHLPRLIVKDHTNLIDRGSTTYPTTIRLYLRDRSSS
jgi:hypothetical protein